MKSKRASSGFLKSFDHAGRPAAYGYATRYARGYACGHCNHSQWPQDTIEKANYCNILGRRFDEISGATGYCLGCLLFVVVIPVLTPGPPERVLDLRWLDGYCLGSSRPEGRQAPSIASVGRHLHYRWSPPIH